ncbi:hypothetical protein FQN57_004663 [Myotisia sp. PD_48]|nr:hypothetical protein FQN57_004663 [Myotisia sp. PD_48]
MVQSFYPSMAVNNADSRPEYRALLIYHFVAAFAELTSRFTLPEPAERIRKLCTGTGQRIPSEQWEAADHITTLLENRLGLATRFADHTPSDDRSTQIGKFDSLYRSLRQLFGSAKHVGCLAIAKIVLFLWKGYFQGDPLFSQIMSWLLLCGNEQNDWLLPEAEPASDQRPLEKLLSGLQISTPPAIRYIQSIQDEAVSLLVDAYSLLMRGEDLVDELRAQMANALQKYNRCIYRYLSSLSMSDINHEMRIRILLIRCEFFLEGAEHDTLEKKRISRHDTMP